MIDRPQAAVAGFATAWAAGLPAIPAKIPETGVLCWLYATLLYSSYHDCSISRPNLMHLAGASSVMAGRHSGLPVDRMHVRRAHRVTSIENVCAKRGTSRAILLLLLVLLVLMLLGYSFSGDPTQTMHARARPHISKESLLSWLYHPYSIHHTYWKHTL
jgi:hypothetical protein